MEMKTILSGISLPWLVSWTYHLAQAPSCLRGWMEADKESCSPSSSPGRQQLPCQGLISHKWLAANRSGRHDELLRLEVDGTGVFYSVGTKGSLAECFNG